ncbi:MAG: hypothetical protein A2Z25_05045 [Planctomycetes bacterium RBG_16_55_9]|nr:MAG: hypothetical protein A2Z25_05045 [Planctomycetes bacterium RBG_16_55_9]
MNFKKNFTFACLVFTFFLAGITQAAPTNGPLRICRDNPRYFADKNGKALLLTGSHVWYNLAEIRGRLTNLSLSLRSFRISCMVLQTA